MARYAAVTWPGSPEATTPVELSQPLEAGILKQAPIG